MEFKEKLRHLVNHWKEHNAAHAVTYEEWAKKASQSGDPELSEILSDIAEKTLGLDDLFERALALLPSISESADSEKGTSPPGHSEGAHENH